MTERELIQMSVRKIFLIAFVIIWIPSLGNSAEEVSYGVGHWDAETWGNHRAVVCVTHPEDAVRVRIPWRRRDLFPEKKNIIIVDAATGKRVLNLLRLDINREFGDIVFQPRTAPGDYFVYYLISKMEGRSNYPTVTYPAPEQTCENSWLKKHRLSKISGKGDKVPDLPFARVKEIQAIDELNSFYPMEVIATSQEMAELLEEYPQASYLIFPEDRLFPIRMTDDLPLRWVKQGPQSTFRGAAARGEFYAFQIGIYACRSNIEDVKLIFTPLKSATSGEILQSSLFASFNTTGTDWTGQTFDKICPIKKGKVQALWCGIQVPRDTETGKYSGSITIAPQDLPASRIEFQLQVNEHAIKDAGDSEPQRHSRLRWLNSQLAMDDGLVPPYIPVKVQGRTLSCLGRNILLGDMGFPVSILSYFKPEMTGIGESRREVLAGPIQLIVEEVKEDIIPWQKQSLKFTHHAEGIVAWKSHAEAGPIHMHCEARMEFDGYMDFRVKITTSEKTEVKDIRLEIPMARDTAVYMMGMGRKGGYRPTEFFWKWEQKFNQDSVWLGDVNAGLQAGFRDDGYSRPLNTNFYLLKPLILPSSWWNEGKGGCDIVEKEKSVLIKTYSGHRRIDAGETLYYHFHLLVTPFRPINPSAQWDTRYYHRYEPVDKIKSTGASTINVHHATEINPFINYPFLRPDEMKAYIDEAHSKNMKVKIYYTVRELTNRTPELFALRSLGDEIFFPGKGGGFSWLQEHLGSDYIAAWFVPQLKDAAIINSGVSRWHNYYVEGLNWLVKNVGIDGLYIDDVAFDRTTMKRVRKILDRNRPGALIDLHSANQFNERDGFANSANLYLEHFPYIDRLWFGEYFDANAPPEFWLVEMSGIPFGLMGEMLQDGGNAWRGMLYGMTSRLPWAGDPRALWKLWDDFGIQEAEMYGYWSPSCPVKIADGKDVLITSYVKENATLISIASWEQDRVQVSLEINWEALGINPRKAILEAPHILEFQDSSRFKPTDLIPVEPGKGWLFVLSEVQ
jgi:hypothetical protein